MGFLLSVDLTTHRAMITALLLTIAVLVVSALVLPLTRRGRAGSPLGAVLPRRAHPWRTAGRWSVRALAMLLPVIMILATGAMAYNRTLKLVTTPRDLFGIISAGLSGPQTDDVQSADGQSDGEQSAHEQTQSGDPALLTDFEPTEESGMLRTTWTGPISGITQPVYAITPAGYRPNDGKKYGVIMTLHGYPGDPEGTMWGAQVSEALQSAIDQGLIPPTIVIGPEVNVDDSEHDCADLPGRPPVFTWVTKDVPAMIKANFPNVSTERAAWMIAGFSSGAYCSVWTAMRAPEVFGSAAFLSGYDTQIEGEMKRQGQQYLAENTLSTMLANRTPDGLRIYAMAAQDDAVGGAPTAVAMANAAKAPDSVTPDTPETGGHAGPLWREHIPTMLAWWGSDNSVAHAVGTPPTAEAAQSSNDFGQIVTSQTVTHRTRPFGVNGVGSLVVVGLLALLSAVFCALRVPRWVAAAGGGSSPSSSQSADPDEAGAVTADRATAAGSANSAIASGPDEAADTGTSQATGGGALAALRSRLAGVRARASRLPRGLRRAWFFTARLVAVSATMGMVALLFGMLGNATGGFYTSWRTALSSLIEAFM
ncbi:putative esterase [Schaalia georgiae F0490]|uniref:Putative esterase n=1 Tax=Schaalia georgiae F0490 TaxID=1125717 RepID=J0NJQ4_9ACTO|nr:alpha/beta hydrolase-fold protein [Schaalia georgiae]EJF47349.1 putative esterase [Schaalia georgiae F0490]